MAQMIIRIRSRDGLERVAIENAHIKIAQLKYLIESQLRVPIPDQTLSTNRNLLLAKTPQDISRFTDMSNPEAPISTLGIAHGSIIYLAYNSERAVAGPSFRPGRSSCRTMTMDDLIAKQMQITRQENPHCKLVSFDRDAANAFQRYVNESLAFAIKRGGIMYGTVSREGKVEVNFIYEPPQRATEDNLILMRDPYEEKLVEAIATGLRMRKVGFIFTQTIGQNRKDYTISNAELLQAAEMHGESNLKEWVTVVVKLEPNGGGGRDVHFEAFQMSDLCVRLYKEGWFENEIGKKVDSKLSRMKKEVVVGGKDCKEVDNDFFLVVVKIFDHQGLLSSTFPIENRNTPVTMRTLKNHLDRTRSLPFVKRISDFHLLLFLARYFDVRVDVPALAECVRTQTVVPEGYQLLIESMASAF